ncbi:hypothetical protein RHPLAN_20230 [Rhodoplanes sp. Z2-YC6860]|nr:hypothetical protein RHPLAN_20230 [Rhodoplanes sp. Z2-YC6860]
MQRSKDAGGGSGYFGPARKWLEGLGPYQSLAAVAVPTAIIEPFKLAAVAICGSGHWFTGVLVIIAAYATGFLLVERLFSVVKPKLLQLHWFAVIWNLFTRCRRKALAMFRSIATLA